MGINWNEEQKKAIETIDKNILVSAAAGSGKTAVLVERIRRLVIDQKIPVDRFLIVTFTKAAASEMKEKIVNAISIAAAEEGADREYLRRQLELLPAANISTFNSFALEVIRRYFYLIDLEPGFKVCDEAQGSLLKMRAIDEVFMECFESGDEDFMEFVSKYGSDRNEKKAKGMVLDLHQMIMSLPEPFLWLEEKTKALDVTEELFKEGYVMEYLLDDSRSALRKIGNRLDALVGLLEDNGCDKMAEKFKGEADRLKRLDYDGMDYDKVRGVVNSLEIKRLAAAKIEKDSFEDIKEEASRLKKQAADLLKKLKEKYFWGTLQDMVLDISETYASACMLKKLVVRFHERYGKLKEERNLLDFSDHEHLALKILENEDAALEYREKFTYIFIDEYQDSNDVQEALIDRIKRENNVFMVGDVKQSIYKFRLAEPEIFMRKYYEYAKGRKEDLRIDLSRNFRSKGRILSLVNDVFLHRMDGYDEEAMLRKGISYEGELDQNPTLVIVDTNADDLAIDEELLLLKNAEIEAKVAAGIIKEVIGETIHEDKTGIERQITYRDIVVLMRSVKETAGIFKDTFEEMGIPCYIDDTEGYFDTIEVSLIVNILSLIDNSRQDVPLIAALYSPVFSFSTDELGAIRIHWKKGAYYEAFERYMTDGEDEELRVKCIQTAERIQRWKRMARAKELSDLVWSVMWDTGYYSYAGTLPGGERRKANLRALADKAKDADNMGIYDLNGFLGYIDSVKEGKINVGQMKTISEADDVVRIMTVHKSKGLEFPVVISSSLGKKFNIRSKTVNMAMHKRIGYAMMNVNHEEKWRRKNILQDIIERQISLESLEEEKRILYVNFTRARDRLYMLGTVNDVTKLMEKVEELLHEDARTPLEYILSMKEPSEHMEVTHVTMNDLQGEETIRKDYREQVKNLLSKGIPYGKEIERRLSYEYPHEKETRMKYKYSVSELAKGEEEYVYPRTVASKVKEKAGFTPSQIGTITHKVMEWIRFDGTPVEDVITELVEKNLLTREEAKAVNREGIERFLSSDLGRRIAGGNPKREQPFTYLMEKDGIEVMVQGIIDCYFEEDGEIVLVDYKNTSITKEEVLKERYEGQLAIYGNALEEILGKRVKEKYLYLLKSGEILKI